MLVIHSIESVSGQIDSRREFLTQAHLINDFIEGGTLIRFHRINFFRLNI